MVKDIASQTLKELEKSKKEPYPLYYREVFNDIIKDKNLELDNKLLMQSYKYINEKLLNDTQKTTGFVAKTNNEIKNNSKKFRNKVTILC